MKAIGYQVSKPILADDSLIDFDVAVVEPGPYDLQVRVRAVSVNPVDIKQRINTARYKKTGRGGKGHEVITRGAFTEVILETPPAPEPLTIATEK